MVDCFVFVNKGNTEFGAESWDICDLTSAGEERVRDTGTTIGSLLPAGAPVILLTRYVERLLWACVCWWCMTAHIHAVPWRARYTQHAC